MSKAAIGQSVMDVDNNDDILLRTGKEIDVIDEKSDIETAVDNKQDRMPIARDATSDCTKQLAGASGCCPIQDSSSIKGGRSLVHDRSLERLDMKLSAFVSDKEGATIKEDTITPITPIVSPSDMKKKWKQMKKNPSSPTFHRQARLNDSSSSLPGSFAVRSLTENNSVNDSGERTREETFDATLPRQETSSSAAPELLTAELVDEEDLLQRVRKEAHQEFLQSAVSAVVISVGCGEDDDEDTKDTMSNNENKQRKCPMWALILLFFIVVGAIVAGTVAGILLQSQSGPGGGIESVNGTTGKSAPTAPSAGNCGNGNVGNGVCSDGTCCSQWGYCGAETAYCGGTGTCGNGTIGNGKCDDGTCCSQWGYCGTGMDYCGNATCGNGNKGNGICADKTCCSQEGWCGLGDTYCEATAAPTSSLPTGPSPSPPTSQPPSAVIGYFRRTWLGNPISIPANSNLAVAFSGWAEVTNALQESSQVLSTLKGDPYLSIGDVDDNGRWTSTRLANLNSAIASGKLSAYKGICYNVEEGDSGLSSAFATSFATAKKYGLKVLVTVSQTAPYGVSDAATLMNSFLSSTSIDYLSPQLFTSGDEGQNDYSQTNSFLWSSWKQSRTPIVVAIVKASYYSDAQKYFLGQGITLGGYLQWSN